MRTSARALRVILASLVLAACTASGREAALVLADIAAGPAPSELKAETPQPAMREVRYRGSDGAHRIADLYVPGQGSGAGVVLVPGLTPEGRRDPRLVPFAETLARARFVVLVPEVPGFKELKVSASDANVIADALRELAPRSACLGLIAISYAVGPAALAALNPDLAPRLDFLVSIGGYYDHVALITFVTTGRYRDLHGAWRTGDPAQEGKWLFLESNLDRVGDAGDRTLLHEIASRRLAAPAAPVDDLGARLGPEGRAVLALLENRDPERVPDLIGALPGPIRREIAALSLAGRDLSALPDRVVLVHGRDDPVIPWTESARLAAAIGEDRADLYLVGRMAHVDVEGIGLADQFRLWRAVAAVLRARGCGAGT